MEDDRKLLFLYYNKEEKAIDSGCTKKIKGFHNSDQKNKNVFEYISSTCIHHK